MIPAGIALIFAIGAYLTHRYSDDRLLPKELPVGILITMAAVFGLLALGEIHPQVPVFVITVAVFALAAKANPIRPIRPIHLHTS